MSSKNFPQLQKSFHPRHRMSSKNFPQLQIFFHPRHYWLRSDQFPAGQSLAELLTKGSSLWEKTALQPRPSCALTGVAENHAYSPPPPPLSLFSLEPRRHECKHGTGPPFAMKKLTQEQPKVSGDEQSIARYETLPEETTLRVQTRVSIFRGAIRVLKQADHNRSVVNYLNTSPINVEFLILVAAERSTPRLNFYLFIFIFYHALWNTVHRRTPTLL